MSAGDLYDIQEHGGYRVAAKNPQTDAADTTIVAAVALTDPTTGLPVTLSGGGTEYVEDAVATANPTGGALILVRRDALTGAEVSADGDYVAGKATSKGELYTKATDTDTILGAVAASPTANTIGDRLKVINTTLGTPLQAGGNIGNVSGTISLPTGASTAAKQPALGTAGTAATDVLTVQGIASMTALKVDGSAATQPISGSLTTVSTVTTLTGGGVAHDGVDSGNPIKAGGAYKSAPTSVQDGDRTDLLTDAKGNLCVVLRTLNSVNSADVANNQADGNNLSGNNRLGTYNTPFLYNGASWDRDTKPNLVSRIVSAAASTNATSAKASAGSLHHVSGRVAAVTPVYLKLYNKASAPTVGTDTPFMTLALDGSGAFRISFNRPLYFSTGIAYALTAAVADADTTALSAADVVGLNVGYS